MASWESWRDGDVSAELARTPIAVLMGGTSDERDVSLTSGASVLGALTSLTGPSYKLAPPVFAIEIDHQGLWRLDGAALTPQRAVEALPEETVYLLALHGGSGEDGRVQGFLELCGRRYTGSGPQTSALCMDKHRSRLVAASAGIRVAPGGFATARTILEDPESTIAGLHQAAPGVSFVKLATGGSSIGVHRCTTPEEVSQAALALARAGGDVLIEQAIVGLETTAAVIGDGLCAATLPIAEIEPRGGTFFDLEQKYAAEGGAVETCPPKTLPPSVAARIQERACTAWEAFGGTGYARIDFIAPGERRPDGTWFIDLDAEPVMLEANTLPGFTPRSLLPLSARAEGVAFRELCLELVARALQGRDSRPAAIP